MKIDIFNTFPEILNLYKKDQNNREIKIYKFEDCCLTGHNLYYPNVLLKTNNNLILPLLERTMSLNMGNIYENNNMNYNCQNININYNLNYIEPVFFFIYNTDNYFHFLYDTVPYLISYITLKKEIPGLKLLVQYPNEQKKDFYLFVSEFFEIIDIKKNDIVTMDPNTKYKTIYVSTSYTHDFDSNLPPRQEIYNFYQDIANKINIKYKINTPKKLYISRRTWIHNNFSNIGTNYTTRRKLINEDAIVDTLIKKGYTEVFTENLSTIEKILYFANATHIVGAIGGGISNVLFSPKTTKLEVLVSPTFLDVNYRFKYSLDNVDTTYNINSEHSEKSEFKTYMRIKIKNSRIIGEIEKIDINKNKLLISYTDGSNTGWNAQSIYKKIEVDINKDIIEKLDNGLNSPWVIQFKY